MTPFDTQPNVNSIEVDEYDDLRERLDDHSSRKYPDVVLKEFKADHEADYVDLFKDGSEEFKTALNALDRTLDTHLADRLRLKLAPLDLAEPEKWRTFLGKAAQNGLPWRSGREIIDIADDKIFAKKILDAGDSLDDFADELSKGLFAFYADEVDWLEMVAGEYPKWNSASAEPVVMGEKPVQVKTVHLNQDDGIKPLPDHLEQDEAFKAGFLVEMTDGSYKPAMGYMWAHPEQEGNWAVVRERDVLDTFGELNDLPDAGMIKEMALSTNRTPFNQEAPVLSQNGKNGYSVLLEQASSGEVHVTLKKPSDASNETWDPYINTIEKALRTIPGYSSLGESASERVYKVGLKHEMDQREAILSNRLQLDGNGVWQPKPGFEWLDPDENSDNWAVIPSIPVAPIALSPDRQRPVARDYAPEQAQKTFRERLAVNRETIVDTGKPSAEISPTDTGHRVSIHLPDVQDVRNSRITDFVGKEGALLNLSDEELAKTALRLEADDHGQKAGVEYTWQNGTWKNPAGERLKVYDGTVILVAPKKDASTAPAPAEPTEAKPAETPTPVTVDQKGMDALVEEKKDGPVTVVQEGTYGDGGQPVTRKVEGTMQDGQYVGDVTFTNTTTSPDGTKHTVEKTIHADAPIDPKQFDEEAILRDVTAKYEALKAQSGANTDELAKLKAEKEFWEGQVGLIDIPDNRTPEQKTASYLQEYEGLKEDHDTETADNKGGTP